MNDFGRLSGLLLFLVLLAMPAFAQDRTLALGDRVEDTLAPNETHRYSLLALEWTLASLRVEALSETLDPQLAIYDSSGELVIANDDYAYPDSLDAIIQAFVFPKSDRYTVAVSGFDGASGAYQLHLLPGYDLHIHAKEKLLLEDWQVVNRLAAVSQAGSNRLVVETDGMATTAVMLGTGFAQERDFYFEVQFDNVSSANDWQVGIAFRYARPDSHSRVLLNKRGFWRMERVDEGDIVIVRNWGTHPAIVPGESEFRLGVLASGEHFDIVYNGQIVGMIGDDKSEDFGGVGVAMRTADVVGSRLSFSITDALMTIPTRVDEAVIVPSQLLTRSYHVMDNVLARQQLIPVDSEIKMLLPQSSVRRRLAGVTPFLLGSGLRFAEMAIGATVSYQMSEAANGGCGILFHFQDEEHYQLAYLTAEGDYGLSQRQGEAFAPGIYANKPTGARHEHDMLLIVYSGAIHYYVDNEHVGQLAIETAAPGSVGIAVVNYARVETNCVFEDFWVLSLDG
ncbi:MAG: hypothetical protein OXI40_08905 [Chloroflexota bacterium]|nr:hypothetical protein [Chloroflexota bacterium]